MCVVDDEKFHQCGNHTAHTLPLVFYPAEQLYYRCDSIIIY